MAVAGGDILGQTSAHVSPRRNVLDSPTSLPLPSQVMGDKVLEEEISFPVSPES